MKHDSLKTKESRPAGGRRISRASEDAEEFIRSPALAGHRRPRPRNPATATEPIGRGAKSATLKRTRCAM